MDKYRKARRIQKPRFVWKWGSKQSNIRMSEKIQCSTPLYQKQEKQEILIGIDEKGEACAKWLNWHCQENHEMS